MNKVLIIKFEVIPEVIEYMSSRRVDLETALRDLDIELSDGVDTRLMLVDKDSIEEYGKEDDDYVVVTNMDVLEFWGYDLEEVCEDLGTDIEGLREMGIKMDSDL